MHAFKFTRYCKPVAGLLAIVVLTSGCASGLSKDECQTADWRTIGYEDGVQGHSESRIGGHRKACAGHGVALDLDAYRSGWEEGMRRYCKSANGYLQGRNGRQYSGVCSHDLEPAFLDAYRDGRELFEAESDVQRVARKLRHKRKRLAHIETDMRDTGIELVSPGLRTEQRVVLLDELRKLEEERAAIRARIPVLEDELAMHKERLAAISSRQNY